MEELNNQNEFKEKDEIDAYFSDAKKKSFPLGIIFIIIFLIIIGSGIYYYFVIDSPQNIFIVMLSNKVKNIDTDFNYKKTNYNFSLNTNITTTNKEYIEIADILNKLSLTGNINQDLNAKQYYLNLNTLYEENDLLDLDAYLDNENLYLSANDIYDKVIKVDLSQSEEIDIDESFNNSNNENQTKINELLIKNIIKTLKDTKCTKEYIKLNDSYSKKVSLTIDKHIMESFYNNLLNDTDFMKNYSESEGITTSELKEKIQEKINNLDNQVVKLSLYVSLIKNEFIMLEVISNDNENRITITEENNKYNYKYYENSIIKFQGFIFIEKENDNYQISLSFEDIEEQLNIELNLNLSFQTDKNIEPMDITNTVDYNSLTEKELNQILLNIMNNKTLLKLLSDINILSLPFI